MKAGDRIRVPLFPLPDAVLFPGMRLPLHVFEPRYRRLIEDAVSGNGLIAIPRLKPGYEADYYDAPALFPICGVGTLQLSRRFDDGRFDIEVEGVARLKLLDEVQSEPYRVALGLVLADTDATNDAPIGALRGELGRLLSDLDTFWSEAGAALVKDARTKQELGAFTDALANLLETPDARQRMLEESSPTERAVVLIGRLHQLLGRIQGPSSQQPN